MKGLTQILTWPLRSAIFVRHCHVRVRFAPSPTGSLHLGGLRTALYNYFFARSQGGKMILRIEDTDQTRSVSGAAEKLQETLSWMGIHFDEGPFSGGQFGPYTQSERFSLYQDSIKLLLENGSAYRCFCTESRLALLRKESAKRGEKPRYDGRCRHLSPDDVDDRIKRNVPHVVRFQLPSTPETFEDLVYGSITLNVAEQEGDPILMKSDGFPTYHFANVVDDHQMKISHVLRGVEWQISTTKHILLCRAFGFEPPKYAHLPLIVNADGTKLSKRQGDISLESFKTKGYHPEAILNFITAVGGGCDNRGDRYLTVDDLISNFSLHKLQTRSGRLEMDRLDTCNRMHIHHLLTTAEGTCELVDRVRQLVKRTFGSRLGSSDLQHKILGAPYIEKVLKAYKNRIFVINDLVMADFTYLWVVPEEINEGLLNSLELNAEEVLRGTIQMLALIPEEKFSVANVNKLLRCHAENTKLKYNSFMKLLRVIISSLKDGPGVAEMMEILGKEETEERLRHGLSLLASKSALNLSKTKDLKSKSKSL